jgi:hypothetical protein
MPQWNGTCLGYKWWRWPPLENRVHREIYTNKREGVIGVWRKLYTEENHNLCYCWDDQIKEDGMDGKWGDERGIQNLI